MKWDERTDIIIAIVWLKESRQTEDNVKDNIITTIKRGMRTMMISPETYYEDNLKGKSAGEIFREIQSLKREIKRLIKIAESNDVLSEKMCEPSPLTQIKVNREYLERAKIAYAEVGGEYKPTKAEMKGQEFNESLRLMKKFEFEYGGFFNGYETRSYTIVGEKVLLDLRHSFRQKPFDFPVYEPVTKEEFLEGLAELHIGEWKKNYVSPMLDGTQWSIDIEYEGDRKPVHIYGSNSFPYNFDDLLEFLGVDSQEYLDDDGDEV